MQEPTASPRPAFCLGCGHDHRNGRDCGYAREIRWTEYGPQERFQHVRVFPVLIGLAAASAAIYFVLRPPEQPHLVFLGVGLTSLIAALFGGFGTKALIEELRKTRYRLNSTDGRDRGLVVFVGDELRYGFGESLKYRAVGALEYTAPLSSAAALALGDELEELMNDDLAAWLRTDSEDETLLREPNQPDSRLAIVVAMAVLGLSAREQMALSVGRYKAWGWGGGKLPHSTTGAEVALEALEAISNGAGADDSLLEREFLNYAQPNAESPTALDSIIDAVAGGQDAEALLGALEEDERNPLDLDAAREAWRRVQTEEGDLVMLLLQHALPGRPGTIGVDPDAAAAAAE
ncbi:MAG: hypothetical protein JRH11_10725 [Deltaproteobacteria bacterium]|nr:hypothetical protein [Deltaproteobacteria bacterium]